MDRPYSRDRIGGKILGICSGLARSTDYDPLPIRGIALLALLIFGPITVLAYLLVAWLAD